MMSLKWGFLVWFPWEGGVYQLWPDQPHELCTSSRPNFLKVCYNFLNRSFLYARLQYFSNCADYSFNFSWPDTLGINLSSWREDLYVTLWRLPGQLLFLEHCSKAWLLHFLKEIEMNVPKELKSLSGKAMCRCIVKIDSILAHSSCCN
jgi:hypothetical protein